MTVSVPVNPHGRRIISQEPEGKCQDIIIIQNMPAAFPLFKCPGKSCILMWQHFASFIPVAVKLLLRGENCFLFRHSALFLQDLRRQPERLVPFHHPPACDLMLFGQHLPEKGMQRSESYL